MVAGNSALCLSLIGDEQQELVDVIGFSEDQSSSWHLAIVVLVEMYKRLHPN